MSLYDKGQPVATHQFRDNTFKQKGTMLNVTFIPKRCMCIRCKKPRKESTGTHSKNGFVCGMCGNTRGVR